MLFFTLGLIVGAIGALPFFLAGKRFMALGAIYGAVVALFGWGWFYLNPPALVKPRLTTRAAAVQQPHFVAEQVYVGAESNSGMNIQFRAKPPSLPSQAQCAALITIERPLVPSVTTVPVQM